MQTTENTAAAYSLRNASAGFAEVWRGRLMYGEVFCEKFGSTRTGTHWVARNLRGRTIGHGDTREQAAGLVAQGPRL